MSGKTTRTGETPENTFTKVRADASHSIAVTRTSTGKYGWEIKLYFQNDEAQIALDALDTLDKILKARYGTSTERDGQDKEG